MPLRSLLDPEAVVFTPAAGLPLLFDVAFDPLTVDTPDTFDVTAPSPAAAFFAVDLDPAFNPPPAFFFAAEIFLVRPHF